MICKRKTYHELQPVWPKVRKRQVVLDPFGGSGTTAIAAVKEGRRFVHIDPSPLSVECLLSRLRPYLRERKNKITIVSWTRAGERELAKRGISIPGMIPRMGERSDLMSARMARALPWDDGRNWVLLGDCFKWMECMPNGFVDLIYLDPPFNTGKDFGSYSDNWKGAASASTDLYIEDEKTRAKVYKKIKRGMPLEP